MPSTPISDEELAVRAHDVTTCLEGAPTSEFDTLPLVGNAVTLALHLRDCPPVAYQLVKDVCVHALRIHPREVEPVLQLLEDARMVDLIRSGKTVQTVSPDIDVFANLYNTLGAVAQPKGLTEHEQLTVHLMKELAQSPIKADTAYSLGAEKKVVKRVLDMGEDGDFIIKRRARGQDVFLSPSYFSENADGYANLVAMPGGSGRVRKILNLLKQWQGWPLEIIRRQGELGGVRLTPDDIAAIEAFAGSGFLPPPAINTSHHGNNHFIFGPRPGSGRLPINQRQVYENALALVAAVRQGQLLFSEYPIRSPAALLRALRDKGFIKANTEAPEQYKEVAARRICRLVPISSKWARLELIAGEATGAADNIAAVNLAIDLVTGSEITPSADDEVVLAFQKGQSYVESLVARKRLVRTKTVRPPDDVEHQVNEFLLRGL